MKLRNTKYWHWDFFFWLVPKITIGHAIAWIIAIYTL